MSPKFILSDIIAVLFRLWSNESVLNKFALAYLFISFRIKSSWHRRFSNRAVFTENILGFTISFLSYDSFLYSFKEIYIYQIYNFKSIKNNPFIIDCGSNIGMSILFFKTIYPQATILGFEPEPKNFSLLENNITNNGLTGITIYPVALSNKETKSKFTFMKDASDSLRGTLLGDNTLSYIEVDTAILSSYINAQVDFLKMDIEGGEVLVMEELISKDKLRFINEMIVEYHQNIIDKQQTGMTIFVENIEKYHNYKLIKMGEPDFKNQLQDILIGTKLRT